MIESCIGRSMRRLTTGPTARDAMRAKATSILLSMMERSMDVDTTTMWRNLVMN